MMRKRRVCSLYARDMVPAPSLYHVGTDQASDRTSQNLPAFNASKLSGFPVSGVDESGRHSIESKVDVAQFLV